MSRSVIAAAVVGLVVLAGCGGTNEPSAPPTSEDALTTATTAPDVAEETSEVAPTTEAPEETESADGPPEMPDEAKEQTEAGAEAFALHYIDLINYTGMQPETGLLEPLAADDCKSCENHEESVRFGVEHGDYLEADTFDAATPDVILTEASARVEVPIHQAEQTYLNDGEEIDRILEAASATMVFRLHWDGGWTISEITVGD